MQRRPLLRQCEATENLPQRIDIEAMRKEFALKIQVEEEKKKKDKSTNIPREPRELIDSKILPVFDKYSYEIKEKLSLRHNEYLREKFNRFIDNHEERIVNIRLYRESSYKKPKARPIALNGQFYDVHNRLAPIPYMPDSRQYEPKTVKSKSESMMGVK